VTVNDLWHKKHPEPGEKRCGSHRLVPSAAHGKGKRYQVRVIDKDGRELPRESFEYESEADDRDVELRAAVKAGTVIDDKAGKTHFEQYARECLKTWAGQDHNTAERTLSQFVNHCFEDPESKGRTPTGRQPIGQHSMTTLARRASLMREWAADVRLQANAKLLLIGYVTAVFDAAVDDMIVPRNPLRTKSFTRPKRTQSDVIVWTAEEIEAACELLPEELRALGYLGAVTGGRQGELLGAEKDDFDFLRKTVTYSVQVVYTCGRLVFKPLKNDQARTVPLAAPALPVLSEHMRLHPPVAVTLPWSEKGDKRDGKPVTRMLVFYDKGGRAYYRQTVNRPWRKAWTAAGIKDQGRKNGMHILRHSVAARWLSKGLNPAKVAAYLGDTVAVVLEYYSHWLPEDDDLGRAIVDEYITPGRPASKPSGRHADDMKAV
jgi:integrase